MRISVLQGVLLLYYYYYAIGLDHNDVLRSIILSPAGFVGYDPGHVAPSCITRWITQLRQDASKGQSLHYCYTTAMFRLDLKNFFLSYRMYRKDVGRGF